jgi:hypothetical protein
MMMMVKIVSLHGLHGFHSKIRVGDEEQKVRQDILE